MKRGIITSANKVIDLKNGNNLIDGGVSECDLRYFALYWDSVLVPTNQIVHIELPNERDWIESGVLERPIARLGETIHIDRMEISNGVIKLNKGSEAHCVIEQSLTSIIKDKIQNDEGIDWTLHQFGGNDLDTSLSDSNFSDRQTIRLKLQSLLPTPVENVSVNDILDFKFRRRDELENLHNSINDVYLKIICSGDVNLSSLREITRLKDSLNNLDKVSNERWKLTSKYSLSFDFINSGKALFALKVMEMPTISSVFGAILLGTKFTKTLDAAVDQNKNILAYISDAKKEGIAS